MYLDLYKIDGTINYDTEPCFHNPDTYPRFQEELQEFKDLITVLVTDNISRTFYKFGDGDYRFLRKEPVGSATPCLLYTSPSPRDVEESRMPSSA